MCPTNTVMTLSANITYWVIIDEPTANQIKNKKRLFIARNKQLNCQIVSKNTFAYLLISQSDVSAVSKIKTRNRRNQSPVSRQIALLDLLVNDGPPCDGHWTIRQIETNEAQS